MTDPRPPIPMALAARPTVAGLVVPWVNVRLADGGVDYRSAHHSRWLACWTNGLCQTCGQDLQGPAKAEVVVFLGGPNQLDTYFDEPPLHPACASYAGKACPMVAGRMSHYADRPHVSNGPRGQTCPEPGCDCGGWTPHTHSDAGGAPAHEWWQVWARDWALAVDPKGTLLGGRPVELRRRQVSRPGQTG